MFLEERLDQLEAKVNSLESQISASTPVSTGKRKYGVQGYFYLPFAYITNSKLASDMWYISKAKGL
jgi:hypothetical protein